MSHAGSPGSADEGLARVRARRILGMRLLLAFLLPSLVLMGGVLFVMAYRGSSEDAAGQAVAYFCTAYWEMVALAVLGFIEERRAVAALGAAGSGGGGRGLVAIARAPLPPGPRKAWYRVVAFWCIFLLVPVSALSFIRRTWRGRAVDLSVWVASGMALPLSVAAILDFGPTSTWIGPVARSEALWSAAAAGAGAASTCAVAAAAGFLAGARFPGWRDYAGTCVLGEPSKE